MKISIILIIGVIGLLVAACGADATSTPNRTSAPTSTAAPATATPTTEAAGAVPTPTSTLAGSPASTPTTAATAVTPAPQQPTSAPTTTSPGPARPATLEIRATDAPPPEGVSKILVTVSNIEVNVELEDTAGGWLTVVAEPKTFDLMEIMGVEELLGTADLMPGEYNQVRLNVEKVVVTLLGTDIEGRVPSGKLRIVGQFTAVAGETTILTLDFDAGKLVVITGNGQVIVKPTIRLLVRKGEEALSAAKVAGDLDPTSTPDAVDTLTPTPITAPEPTLTPTPTIEPTPTPTPEPKTVSTDIQNFASEDLAIRVGDTVTWTQRDGIPHTATSGRPGDADVGSVWDSLFLNQGESFSHTFDQPGEFRYFCTIHPTTAALQATITVVP